MFAGRAKDIAGSPQARLGPSSAPAPSLVGSHRPAPPPREPPQPVPAAKADPAPSGLQLVDLCCSQVRGNIAWVCGASQAWLLSDHLLRLRHAELRIQQRLCKTSCSEPSGIQIQLPLSYSICAPCVISCRRAAGSSPSSACHSNLNLGSTIACRACGPDYVWQDRCMHEVDTASSACLPLLRWHIAG